LAGFQVSIIGRIWVSTEAPVAEEAKGSLGHQALCPLGVHREPPALSEDEAGSEPIRLDLCPRDGVQIILGKVSG